jgi:chloramphenicol 3-O phosphotransferase
MKGKIIFLNGASSSGKTVLSKALQSILEEPYLHISIDRFLDMLPPRYIEEERQTELTEEDIAMLSNYVPRIVRSFHESVAVLAANGVNVIVDHVLQEPNWLSECVALWQDCTVLFVGVMCPLEELERRERERDREPGTARKQSEIVHAHGIYDLEVDTARQNPSEIAQLIKAEVKHISGTTAFGKLGEMQSASQTLANPGCS